MTMHRALAISVGALLFAAACGDDGGGFTNAPCEDDTNCNLSTGGKCLLAASGNKWCAYPDPSCSGGFRFSDQVGDDLSNVCLEAERVQLTVSIDGPGTVASVPGGITCTATQCTGDFIVGTEIKLVATAGAMPFLGWTGACKGLSDCTVTLVADTAVGAFFGAPGTALWAKKFGGVDADEANGVARDSQDNLFVVGRFFGTADFGGTMHTSAGGGDVFVAKLRSSDGGVLWVRRFGGTGQDIARGVAVDSTDAVYLVGSFNNTVDFGGGPVTAGGAGDLFILKLDGSGAHVWSRTYGSSNGAAARAVAIRNGKVVVIGTFGGTMMVGATTLTGGGGLALQLTTAGAVDWAKAPGSGQLEVKAIAIDSVGNSVITGSFIGTTTVGTQTFSSAGDKDIVLAKLQASNGSVLFAARHGGIGVDDGTSIAIDPSDGIYVGGSFTSTIDFGVGPMTAMGTAAYATKFSIAGAGTWSKQFGGDNAAAYAVTTALSANANGDVVAAGSFTGTISLGGAPLNAVPSAQFSRDVFAGHLKGNDGSHVSSIRTGGQGDELGNSVVQTSDGKYFAVGSFNGFADFGGHSLTSAGLRDAFAFAMAPL